MSVKGVVHCKREPFDVYIGRPSKWGNPFPLVPEVGRYNTLQHYKMWVVGNRDLLLSLHELDNMVLGCWCAPNLCHGHVLAELVDLCLYDLDRPCEKQAEKMFCCTGGLLSPKWEPWTHCEEYIFD